MTRDFGQFSKEFIEEVETYYANNAISLDELSAHSQELFGQHIPLHLMRYYASERRWGVLKARARQGLSGLPESREEELALVLERVLDALLDTENPPGPRDIANLTSAYLNLSKLSTGPGSGTAKTSFQQVIDQIEESLSGNRGDTTED